ncbi:MAG TPA: YbhB/YbcL family Raf kinase inhibitor-like protein [Kiritimatiellia bacterium]|nr:YbhB/YbcL family Raf kinase inhibitor-like protein [Kiritimatiellia bacterium]
MNLTSTAFRDGEPIPARFTCKGENLSPPLAWSGAPAGTACFALLLTDPDAPGGEFLHWMLFNLPASCASLEAGISNNFKLSNGGVQGLNDFGRPGYGGPCPPPGRSHRYTFHLFALDRAVEPRTIARAADLLRVMERHILARAALTGTFRR